MKLYFKLVTSLLSVLSLTACIVTHKNQATQIAENINLFVIGDSTASYYNPQKWFPRTGWAMALEDFVASNVTVVNRARSGRSSRSFMQEGRFDEFKHDIEPGDYLFIQFGHNDQKEDRDELYVAPYTDYQAYLTEYIQFARKRGATPVLLTSINRVTFNDSGKIEPSLGEYPNAMRQLAKQMDVVLIDLNKLTEDTFNQLGEEKTKDLFLFYEPGEYKNFPNGASDISHPSIKGARFIANLAATEMAKSLPELVK